MALSSHRPASCFCCSHLSSQRFSFRPVLSRCLHVSVFRGVAGIGAPLSSLWVLLGFQSEKISLQDFSTLSFIDPCHLTNRWSQPLAALKSTFAFMKKFFMLATLALPTGASATSPHFYPQAPCNLSYIA